MGAGMRRNSSIFQSTLPQGERLFGIYSRQRYCFISIHAPARGATVKKVRDGEPLGDFNPRSRKGSDT